MGQYYITDEVAADLAKLWDGYVERGGTEENADHLIASLFESFQNIADFPDMGTPRHYLPPGVLALPHQKQMIFYRKTKEGVDIYHVLYGGMDLEAYFSEQE
jgi:plasmid stabilization system protein ParE